MSGFEVAGIILGAYPIIQNALEGYRATRGGKGAVSLARLLKTEEIIFKEFVSHLLAPQASGQILTVSETLVCQRSSYWNSLVLQKEVKTQLGAEKAENVIAILNEINELLANIQEELAPVDNGIELLRKFRTRMRYIKLNMPQSTLKEQLETLTACNTQLQRLLTDRWLPGGGTSPKGPKSSKLSLWREDSHAIDIYNVLCRAYSCSCHVPHRANFGSPRVAIEGKSKSVSTKGRKFELLFAVDELSMEEPETKPADVVEELAKSWSHGSNNSDSGNGSRRFSISECEPSREDAHQTTISDLCLFTKSCGLEDTSYDYQMGVLRLEEKEYQLQSPVVLQGPKANIKNLDQLLTDQHFLLSRPERMSLALGLSHAVLSLYSTPWIEACWTWSDFCIDRSEGQLFAAHNFYSCSKVSLGPDCRESVMSDIWEIRGEPRLTRLGFALIELALGRRLADLRPDRKFQSSDVDILDFLTAKSLIETGRVMQAESKLYQDVCNVCLFHQFITDTSEVIGLNSSTAAFQDNAEQLIVAPLHSIVSAAQGGIV